MSRNLQTANHITYDCHYHIVWCTKYRLDLLKDGADDRLKKIIYQVAQEFDASIEELEVMEDHVHVLLSCYPHITHNIVRMMKGRSSKVLREEFSFIKSRTPSLWTMKYCILTDNGSDVSSIIQQYVKEQELR